MGVFLHLHAVLAVIIEAATRLEIGVASVAVNDLFADVHAFLHLLGKVDAEAVNDTVSLREGMKVAAVKGTGESFHFFLDVFGVFGAKVEVQGLLLQESLVAYFTDVIEFLHVFFHVIVHGVLAFLDDMAFRANKMAIGVLVIRNGHLLHVGWASMASIFIRFGNGSSPGSGQSRPRPFHCRCTWWNNRSIGHESPR